MRTTLARAIGVLLFLLVAAAPRAADPPLTRAQSDAFLRKVDLIADPAGGPARRRVSLSEGEMNSWFQFGAPGVLPPGVADPSVSLIGAGRVSGKVVVDLDRVPRRKNPSLFDPWSLLSGRVPVMVTGTLRTSAGSGTFNLETAQLAGITVPKFLIQELLAAYSRSPQRPDGMSLDGPFSLPARIQQIDVQPGQALVVQ